MSERVIMPALGESVTEGTVTRWLKNVGDPVAVDEPLLEVSTDKVDTEIPSPVAGTLQEILVAEDETVPVGTDLAVVGDGVPAPADTSTPTAEPALEQVRATPAVQEAPQPVPEAHVAETPVAEAPVSPPPASGAPVEAGTTVTMPALGESVTEGTVTRWLKAEGDQIEVDEPLLEVSTDKVDTEIPSPVAGIITRILVTEDETVPVGADLAVIGGAQVGEGAAPAAPVLQAAPESTAPAAPATPASDAPPAPVPVAPAAAPTSDAAASAVPAAAPATAAPVSDVRAAAPGARGADASAYVTPLVRKLASDNNVDLGSVKGTGIGGRIRKQDVLDYAAAAKVEVAKAPAAAAAAPSASTSGVSPKRGTTEKMSRLRKVIAAR